MLANKRTSIMKGEKKFKYLVHTEQVQAMQRALVEYKDSWIRSVVMISFDRKAKNINTLNELRVS